MPNQFTTRYLIFDEGIGIARSLYELHVCLPVPLKLRFWQTISFQEQLRIELQLLVRDCPLRIILQELQLLLQVREVAKVEPAFGAVR